jgi:alkylation response protein AidB-like acyl-CoA dehydrogenase
MAANQNVNASEEQARQLVEDSRETSWNGRGFLRNLFLGDFRIDWIDPYPETALSPEYLEFERKLEAFLIEKVDSAKIDATGEYGDDVIQGFFELGAFGMKIDKAYGGMGFNNVEYCKALEIVGRYDGNCVALLSAHQSIGVPQPLKLFGTPEQKKKFLPICAREGVSAFALTEPDVGSDPARLGTQVTRDADGNYVITGEKLWCSNGTIAKLYVVMARHPDSGKISAFVVEREREGVEVAYRCHFMGLKALANGVIKFNEVKVPPENIIGKEGQGLRIALTTLNTGRLSIPAACVGSAKAMLEECRLWSTERVQWGQPVGKHEVIGHKLADMAATTFGMESISYLATELSEREGYDIRLEASAAKEWCTTRGWTVIDEAMQIKGGRGYETEASLKGRGERPAPIERAMRDSRINRIFEGSSEIMHLMMARELVDKHLKVAGVMLDNKAPISAKIKALPSISAFYARWYLGLWFGWLWRPSYDRFGKMARHLKFIEGASRRLARAVFHGMMLYQAKLERKQAFMFRAVDIAMELFVMSANIVRTRKLLEARAPEAKAALELTELSCLNGRRYVEQKFKELWANDDDAKYAVGRHILEERHAWLEPKTTYTGGAGSEAAAAK